jgi:hypothetical protein
MFQELAEELGLSNLQPKKEIGPRNVRYLPNTTGVAPKDMHSKYRTINGCFVWASRMWRADFLNKTRMLGSFLANPSFEHYDAAIWALEYGLTTSRWGLKFTFPAFPVPRPLKLQVLLYTDADWNKEWDCRSVSSWFMRLCLPEELEHAKKTGIWPVHNFISAKSRKQAKLVADSTTTSETAALAEACKDLMWMRNMLEEADMLDDGPSPSLCDNSGVVLNTNENRWPTPMRHHALKFAIIEDCLDNGVVQVFKIPTADNVSDMGTKDLFGDILEKHMKSCMDKAPDK